MLITAQTSQALWRCGWKNYPENQKSCPLNNPHSHLREPATASTSQCRFKSLISYLFPHQGLILTHWLSEHENSQWVLTAPQKNYVCFVSLRESVLVYWKYCSNQMFQVCLWICNILKRKDEWLATNAKLNHLFELRYLPTCKISWKVKISKPFESFYFSHSTYRYVLHKTCLDASAYYW